MTTTTTIGIDLAKRVFQLHGAAAAGSVTFPRKLSRDQLLPFLASHPSRVVAMEACATAHDRGRTIAALGHAVRPIPPAYDAKITGLGVTLRAAAAEGVTSPPGSAWRSCSGPRAVNNAWARHRRWDGATSGGC